MTIPPGEGPIDNTTHCCWWLCCHRPPTHDRTVSARLLSNAYRYFVDGMLPKPARARTVMVCSPKRQVYKVRCVQARSAALHLLNGHTGLTLGWVALPCSDAQHHGRHAICVSIT
jgi:hypothetical protein